jgi:DNA-binding transcriptional MocR family regulator
VELRLPALDPRADVPLYLQVANAIEQGLKIGHVHVGQRLPAERRLAEQLGISRTTATYAYEELRARGFLRGHVGRGTIVVASPTDARPALIPWASRVTRTMADATEVCYPGAPAGDGAISFGTGWPDSSLCASEMLDTILRSLTTRPGGISYGPSPIEGEPALRSAVAEWLTARGTTTAPDEVLITAGSQEALTLVARALVSPGDVVVTESPTWTGAIFAFRAAGAEIVGVPVDGDGLRCDLLEDVFTRYRPKLLYVVPDFQNPTGTVLSLARRRLLLELVTRFRVPVLESDIYRQIFFESAPPASLRALDGSGLVLHTGSFTKTVSPGLRIGWLVVPREALPVMAATKFITSLTTSTLTQQVATEFLRGGYADRHLVTVRKQCRLRRDRLIQGLHETGTLRFQVPSGGYYVSAQLPDGVLTADVVPVAQEHGVVVRPGRYFSPEDREADRFRLCFASPPMRQIPEGVRRLDAAVEAVRRRQVKETRGTAKRVPAV